ncbi:MAG: 50S ribosomal protein L24 [Nitrospirota bacterium]|jgi:large subunit ribosomal protein L24
MGLGLRKDDTVVVTIGKEKGKRGRVLAVMPGKERLLVERVNLVKRHMKPSKRYQQGGIIEKEAPVRLSNVRLVCPKCDKPARFGNRVLETGKKVRICKKCAEVIDK